MSMKEQKRCHILVGFRDCFSDDVSGCLKSANHFDGHLSLLKNGKIVEWEDDMTCECGCWDSYDTGFSDDTCKIFHYISVDEAIAKIKDSYGGTIPEEVKKEMRSWYADVLKDQQWWSEFLNS